MEIQVTQKHIDESIRCDHYRCAISLALKDRGIPLGIVVENGYGREGVDNFQINCPDNYTIPMTKEMRDFVRDFDAGHAEPITFEFPDVTYEAIHVETKELEVAAIGN